MTESEDTYTYTTINFVKPVLFRVSTNGDIPTLAVLGIISIKNTSVSTYTRFTGLPCQQADTTASQCCVHARKQILTNQLLGLRDLLYRVCGEHDVLH